LLRRTVCTLHAGPAPAWESSAEQLNRAPLLARDPILYYDEVPLYESELDDNGVSQLSVKARRLDPCRERLYALSKLATLRCLDRHGEVWTI